MKEKLRACPDCGWPVALRKSQLGYYYIECLGCGTQTSFEGYEESKEETVRRWNSEKKE